MHSFIYLFIFRKHFIHIHCGGRGASSTVYSVHEIGVHHECDTIPSQGTMNVHSHQGSISKAANLPSGKILTGGQNLDLKQTHTDTGKHAELRTDSNPRSRKDPRTLELSGPAVPLYGKDIIRHCLINQKLCITLLKKKYSQTFPNQIIS